MMGLHQNDYEPILADLDINEDNEEINRKKALRKQIEEREEDRRLQKELDDFDYDDDFDWDDKF